MQSFFCSRLSFFDSYFYRSLLFLFSSVQKHSNLSTQSYLRGPSFAGMQEIHLGLMGRDFKTSTSCSGSFESHSTKSFATKIAKKVRSFLQGVILQLPLYDHAVDLAKKLSPEEIEADGGARMWRLPSRRKTYSIFSLILLIDSSISL